MLIARRSPHLLLGDDGVEQGDDILSVPLRVAQNPSDLVAFAIDNQCCREAGCAQRPTGLCGFIMINRQALDADLFVETQDLGKVAAIDGKRDHVEIVAAEGGLQPIERRHLLAAGCAPGRPEIQNDDTPLKIRETALITVCIEKRDLGNGTAVRGDKVEGFCRLNEKEGQQGGTQPGVDPHAPSPGERTWCLKCRTYGSCAEQTWHHRIRIRERVDRPLSNRQNEQPKPSSPSAEASDRPGAGHRPGAGQRGVDLWGGHFVDGPAPLMEQINASISFDKRLYLHDLAGSKAHARMLAAVGLLSNEERDAIFEGLEAIKRSIEAGEFDFSPSLEDIHMNIEARLTEAVGEPGRKLHTARSRNDQVATDFRLWLRDAVDAIDGLLRDLQGALIDRAEAHHDWVMPGFTHLQAAQPVTFGHHLMAYVEMFGRDRGRFSDGRARLNECPLGAAALAGTSFPIDRLATAADLGFDRPMANSLDAVSDRDFALEFLASASITAVHLSRLAEELVLWSTPQFGFIKMSEAFSSGSSIMPQKRNPDAAELLRGKSGRIVGSLNGLLMTLKGLPLAYSKDMQEDKEPVFDAVDSLRLCLAAATAMIETLHADREAMKAAAGVGYTTATDLADWMVRSLGVPFREAHAASARAVRLAEQSGVDLAELSLEHLQSIDRRITSAVFEVLTVERSVASRTSFGGTAPNCVLDAVVRAKSRYL